jgi:hypothetical protein
MNRFSYSIINNGFSYEMFCRCEDLCDRSYDIRYKIFMAGAVDIRVLTDDGEYPGASTEENEK